MYFGDIPFSINLFKVGVRPRYKKSARKPSSDMSIVVGAKSEVPLDFIVAEEGLEEGLETWYAIAKKTKKRTVIARYRGKRRQKDERRDCS